MSERALTWKSASLSDPGKVRNVNEDACLELPEQGVWVVADGMGGHDAGDVASSMIVDALRDLKRPDDPGRFVDEVEDRLMEVNRHLFEQAMAQEQPRTIGSTVVVMLAIGRHCVLLWAGDSRVYRLRDSTLRQVTRDHSQVEELIEHGEILREDAEAHPLSNVITRAVGGAAELYLDVELLMSVQPGDRFLLCSDGLYKDLTEDEIAENLGHGDCATACRDLIDLVLAREAADNVTVTVVEASAEGGEASDAAAGDAAA